MSDNSDLEVFHSQRVAQVLSDAKISAKDLKMECQILQFAEVSLPHESRLLEVSDEILAMLERGEKLTFRGDKDDTVVICTKDRTFEVKEAETTNSLLLLPNIRLPEQLNSQTADLGSTVTFSEICGIRTAYLEMKEATSSRCGKLKEILSKTLYDGTQSSDDLGCSLDDLLNSVQASEEEIGRELEKMFVCNINGRYRLLDFDYLSKVMSQMITFVVNENSWPWHAFPANEVLETLESLEPRYILEACLNWFAEPNEDGVLWGFKEAKVTRLYAEMILKAAGKFHFHEFLEVWQQSVPEGMTTDIKQLQSEAIVLLNEKSIPPTIKYFPVESLSSNSQERFDQLFQARPSWDLKDIEPYLRDIATPKCCVGTLLAKFTRSSNGPTGKCYSSKRP